jgi:hypothetical protein
MSDEFNTQIYTDPRTNIEYEVKYFYDLNQAQPDSEFDGHGHLLVLDFDPTDPEEVEERVSQGHPLYGEEFAMRAPLMRLVSEHRYSPTAKWYDFVTSLNIATTEWGVSPEKAYDAVEYDYNYLRGWYNNEWYWIGITIRRADENDPWHEEVHSVGGFESLILDNDEDKIEVIEEMILSLESHIRYEKHKEQLTLPLDTGAVIHLTNYR